MNLRIEDYALIGNMNAAALLGRDGSIDWLCMPRFDSASCFAALLGGPKHGRWRIAPESKVRAVRRRYREETLILETISETDDGVVVHGLPGPLEKWRTTRDEIHADVCEHGFDRRRNTFVQYYGASELDASLLRLPLIGFLPANDSRVVGTIEAIQSDLMEGGLVKRYGHAMNGGQEGTFLPCTFWLVDCLMAMGRSDESRTIYERLLGLCNDVGLLSEEYDQSENRMLGNFPQTLTHIALINSTFNLFHRRSRLTWRVPSN